MENGSGRGKQENQKLKPYLVLQYLMKNSDAENVVPASDLVAFLQEIGISAERRSIYRDIQEINRAIYISESDFDCSIDEADEALKDEEERFVIYDKSKKGFYVRQRHYELDDIRLLAECVYAARFIDEKRARRLVEVVSDLVSEKQAEKIKHDAFLIDRVKTENTATYYNVSTINEAMSKSIDGQKHLPEKISFKYLKCTIQDIKQKVERRGGERYIVSPYKLLINDGNYYLLAFEDKSREIRTFRIDRMKEVKRIGVDREGQEAFDKIDLNSYTQRIFSMFSGEEKRIVMSFASPLLDSVVERLGTKTASYSRKDDHHFNVSAKIEISDQFFSWICGFGERAKIEAPESVVNQFTDFLNRIGKQYKNGR